MQSKQVAVKAGGSQSRWQSKQVAVKAGGSQSRWQSKQVAVKAGGILFTFLLGCSWWKQHSNVRVVFLEVLGMLNVP